MTGSIPTPPEPELRRCIEELIDATIDAEHLPGLVLSVFDRERRWALFTRGSLDHETPRPPDDRSILRIASMTKSFTAAAVLGLRDEGVVTLDAPIADLAPALGAIAGVPGDAPPVTLRHLLTMSAGFANDDPWADRLLDADRATMDDVFSRGVHHAHPTATAYEYSNLGFAMIGRVVEDLTGRSVQDHITARLLGPLGMTDTGWHVPRGDRVATGHRWSPVFGADDDGRWETELEPLGDGGVAPMGGLWSTVADLERWVRFLLDGFPPRNGPDDGPLRRSSRREMQQIHRSHATPGSSAGYGMGLQVLHHATAGTVVSHSGGLPGFGSNMRWLVDHGVGVIALSNRTYAPMAPLTTTIVEHLAARGWLPSPSDLAIGAPRDAVERAHRFLVRVLEPVLAGEPIAWDTAEVDGMGWSPNLSLDEPFDRRQAELSALLGGSPTGSAAFGALRIEHGAAGSFPILGGPQTVVVDFLLDAQVPPRIQHLGFEAGQGD